MASKATRRKRAIRRGRVRLLAAADFSAWFACVGALDNIGGLRVWPEPRIGR